jgi:hypothetical protein
MVSLGSCFLSPVDSPGSLSARGDRPSLSVPPFPLPLNLPARRGVSQKAVQDVPKPPFSAFGPNPDSKVYVQAYRF